MARRKQVVPKHIDERRGRRSALDLHTPTSDHNASPSPARKRRRKLPDTASTLAIGPQGLLGVVQFAEWFVATAGDPDVDAQNSTWQLTVSPRSDHACLQLAQQQHTGMSEEQQVRGLSTSYSNGILECPICSSVYLVMSAVAMCITLVNLTPQSPASCGNHLCCPVLLPCLN